MIRITTQITDRDAYELIVSKESYDRFVSKIENDSDDVLQWTIESVDDVTTVYKCTGLTITAVDIGETESEG